MVQTPHGPWRLAVNVRSDDETNLLFHIEPDFRGAILDAIDALPTGLTTPARDNHALRLDYVRGDLFDTTAMRDVAPARSAIRTSSTTGSARCWNARSEPTGPRSSRSGIRGDPSTRQDQYFHFKPGRGVHDLHMNQGSPPPHTVCHCEDGDAAISTECAWIVMLPPLAKTVETRLLLRIPKPGIRPIRAIETGRTGLTAA